MITNNDDIINYI